MSARGHRVYDESGLTQDECAERLGISRQAVAYHETRALKKLKRLIEAKAMHPLGNDKGDP